MLGVHLSMDDRNVDANVLSWNCRVMKVNKIKFNYIKLNLRRGISICAYVSIPKIGLCQRLYKQDLHKLIH